MNNAAEIPNTLALSPKRRREKKKRSPRGNVENLTQKWHMNDEHGASKRNSVLLVLLTKKQMVPIHKDEVTKTTKWEKYQNTRVNTDMDD